VVWRRYGPIPLRWDPLVARATARASLPFFALNTLGLAHFKADTVLLFLLTTPAAVATYEAGYKLLEVSRIAVRPAAVVFLPVWAAIAAREDWRGFGLAFRRLLRMAGIAGVAAAVALLALAGLLVPLLWGDRYADAVGVTQVLALAVPAVFLSIVATLAAGALRLEGAAAKVLAGCLLINVGLNLVAIPRWGVLGAAGCTVVTEGLATLGLLRLVGRKVRVGAADLVREGEQGAGTAAG
jgi:O-antigen/teichoic acid export membrane protein